MENTIANGSLTRSLAEEVKAFLKEKNMSISDLADRVQYSRPALSRYLSGTYESDATGIEEKLAAYLEEMTGIPHAVRIGGKQTVLQDRGFYASADSAKMAYVCEDAQRDQGLGVIVGESGRGKTYALRLISKGDKVAYVECNTSMGCRDLTEAIEETLGFPMVGGTVGRHLKNIQEFFKQNPGWLLIIDEADKLISRNSINKIEVLRGIFDQSKVGLVLAGEPVLETQIRNYDNRLDNRIDFYCMLTGLSEKEVEGYLSAYPMEPEAMEELKKAAYGKEGCFRRLDRILRNCFRVAREENQSILTLKVVQEAFKRTGR